MKQIRRCHFYSPTIRPRCLSQVNFDHGNDIRPKRYGHLPFQTHHSLSKRTFFSLHSRLTNSSTSQSPHPTNYPTIHPPRLHDKVAVVTGSSSGLGRAIALAYASHGAKLVVCADLHPDPRPGLESETVPTHQVIERTYGGGRAVFVRTDVTRGDDVKGAVDEAVARGGGRLDVMVNNAGLGNVSGSPLIHDLSEEDWDRVMDVNLKGVFFGCKYACAQFLRQDLNHQGRRGWLVNVSSMLGYVGLKGGTAAYCASKGGVLNLTRQVALDYAPHRVHCNALCPGFTKTAMTKSNFEDAAVDAEMKSTTPWGEWGMPADVAKGAVFLGSDDVAWVTGIGLPVDGGYLAQ